MKVIWNFYLFMRLKLLILSFISVQVYGQEIKTIINLKSEISSAQKQGDWILSIKLLNELSKEFRTINKDSSLHYAQLALNLSAEKGEVLGTINSRIKLGLTHRLYGQYSQAISNYREGILLAKREKELAKMGSLYNNLANVFRDILLLDSAIYYGNLNIDVKIQLGNKKLLSSAYNNLGNSLARNSDYQEAINNFKKSLFLEVGQTISPFNISLTSNQPSSGTIRALINIASAFWQLDYFDSAEVYYSVADNWGGSFLTDEQQANLWHAQGNLFKEKSEFKSSLLYYDSSIIAYLSMKNLVEAGKSINNKALSFQSMKDYDSAFFYLDSANSIAVEMANLDLEKVVELNKSNLFREMGDYKKALFHLQNFKSLDSALYFYEKERSISEVKSAYEIVKIERELIQKKSDYLQTRLERNIFLLSSILGLLIVVFVIYRYVLIKKMSYQNKKLHDQEVNQLIANQELKMIQAMIEGQEKERARIAEDLHDRLGSTLSATSMHLDAIEHSSTGDENTGTVRNLLNKAIEDTRQISHNMLSGVLTKFGLIAALKDLKQTIEGANRLSMTLEVEESEMSLSREKELHLFRVIQELISNSLKHAYARHLVLSVEKTELGHQIVFSDDGIGFDLKEVKEGIGLKNVASRLERIEATHELKTSESGTTIIINLAA